MAAPTRRLFRRVLALGLISSVLISITLVTLWQTGPLKRWAQARAVEFFMREIQPHLPFRIEELDADASWHELLAGRMSRIAAVLRWGEWRVRVSGPIEISRPRQGHHSYSVRFNPEATAEPVGALGSQVDVSERSSPVHLD